MATSIPRRALRFGVGAALFGVSWRVARAEEIPDYEERVFRWANGADDRLRLPVRADHAGRHVRHGAGGGDRRVPRGPPSARRSRVLAAGTAAWYGAKLAKPLGGRERPVGVLGDDVRLREGIEGDLGWVSGHTCVATTHGVRPGRGAPRLDQAVAGRDRRHHGVRPHVRGRAPPPRSRRRRGPRDDAVGRDAGAARGLDDGRGLLRRRPQHAPGDETEHHRRRARRGTTSRSSDRTARGSRPRRPRSRSSPRCDARPPTWTRSPPRRNRRCAPCCAPGRRCRDGTPAPSGTDPSAARSQRSAAPAAGRSACSRGTTRRAPRRSRAQPPGSRAWRC